MYWSENWSKIIYLSHPRLTEARARAAASGVDDGGSSESDIEIVGVEKSLNSSRRLSMDDMQAVKIKWKWEVIRVQINKVGGWKAMIFIIFFISCIMKQKGILFLSVLVA